MTDQKSVYEAGLYCISPVDGRETLYTQGLRQYLSEGAFHRYRAFIMIELLISLAESELDRKPTIAEGQKSLLRSIPAADTFNALAVAEYDHFGRNGEGPFEHDVKAVEYYLRETLTAMGLDSLNESLHFLMTSEDNNNLALNLMLRGAVNDEWLPSLLQVADLLAQYAVAYADVPVLGITHGMKASPTTIGKRFSVTLGTLSKTLSRLKQLRLSGKFSGAVGNHNAAIAVVPEFDVESFCHDFVSSFGFEYEDNATQRSSHLPIVELFHNVRVINDVLANLCETVRHSVMLGWLYQEGNDSHVGSSVMPHKINPWFFEVGQSYFNQSTAAINAASSPLLTSVFERDLRDHPWERSYGEMLGKSLIGLKYVTDGLQTLRVNDWQALQDLQTSPEVLSEAVQIAGRYCGQANIYMIIKNLTRGRKLDRSMLDEIIVEHVPDRQIRERLLALTPEQYLGKAREIAQRTAAEYSYLRPSLERGILDASRAIRAVLFDFDSTLHFGDKEELQARLEEISKQLNLGFTSAEIREFGDRSDYKEMRRLMVQAYNLKHAGAPITEEQFEAVGRQVSGTLDHHFYTADFAVALLQILKRRGIKTGLVTTRGAHSLPRLLALHGMAELFDVIINREACAERKPHPKPLLLALQRLGIDDPAQAIYVGDNPFDDVIGGLAAGMETVLVNKSECAPYSARPTYHFTSLKPLLQRFSR
jgi:adenylosuccinate lyase